MKERETQETLLHPVRCAPGSHGPVTHTLRGAGPPGKNRRLVRGERRGSSGARKESDRPKFKSKLPHVITTQPLSLNFVICKRRRGTAAGCTSRREGDTGCP